MRECAICNHAINESQPLSSVTVRVCPRNGLSLYLWATINRGVSKTANYLGLVTAPAAADDTNAAYFANTPVL